MKYGQGAMFPHVHPVRVAKVIGSAGRRTAEIKSRSPWRRPMHRGDEHPDPAIQFVVDPCQTAGPRASWYAVKPNPASTPTRIRPYQICSRHLMDLKIFIAPYSMQ